MVPAGAGSVQLEEPWDDGPGGVPSEEADRRREGLALLRSIGLALGAPRFVFTTEEPNAYPVYAEGARALARETVARLEARAGLAIAGRQGRV